MVRVSQVISADLGYDSVTRISMNVARIYLRVSTDVQDNYQK